MVQEWTIYLSIYLSIYISIYLSIFLSIYPSIYLSGRSLTLARRPSLSCVYTHSHTTSPLPVALLGKEGASLEGAMMEVGNLCHVTLVSVSRDTSVSVT